MREESRSDEALCVAVGRGDEAALRALVQRHRDRAFAILLRSTAREADAEDLFQELWLRVVRAAASFDPSQRFAPWLFRIAVNLARDAARRRAALHHALPTRDGILPDGADEAPLPDEQLVEAGRARALRAAIAALPAGQREVVVLRWLEGLGEAETAEAAGIPPGTVKSRLHHAAKALRERLAPLRAEE